MKTMKKAMSVLLAVVMLIAMLPAGVFAAYQDEFSDFPTGWSKVAMEAAVDNGLLNGFVDGTIKPEANLTRAEMAAIITRAFNAKTKADISAFVDVNPGAWYYDYIAKAVKMGALNGKSSSMMYPDTPITREEVFTAVARVLVLSSDNTSALNRYNDKENISAWALKSMSALAERGYVNGDDMGNAKPKANITREEFAQFMYNTIRTYITKEGTYTKDLEGITVLRVGNVILEGFDNTSDLVLGDGVGEDPVRITDVNVEKRLLARGGRITLQNTTVTEGVVVNNVNGITYFNNYRDEKVFDGIVENTEARFLERGTEGGGAVVKRFAVKFFFNGAEIDSTSIKKNDTIGSSFPDAPLGYTITGWVDGNGTSVTADTVVTGPIEVHAAFRLNEYNISFVDEEDNPISFATLPETTFDVENAYTLPTDAQIDMSAYLGYSFAGWKDTDTGVTVASYDDLKNLLTSTTTEAEGVTLKAVFTLNQYPIVFKNEDGTAFTDWADGFAPDLDYDIETPYALPETINVSRAGYTLTGWKDADGNAVTSVTVTVDSSLTDAYVLKPIFTPHTYNISYVLETGASFKTGYTAPDSYGPNDTTAIIPDADKVSPKEGRYFLYWIDQATGSQLTTLPIYEVNGTTLYLEAVFGDVPPTYYTVRFFEGYNQDEFFMLGKLDDVVSGTYVAEGDIPSTDGYERTGHVKNSSIASVYATEEEHIIKPTYWYVDDTNKLVPFTSEVKIVKDTDVYLLYKNLTSFMSIDGEEFSVTASYEHSTRLLNSMKDMALGARQQLDKALQLDLISGLDEKAMEKLIAANILDSGKHIQKINLPIAIGKVVKRDTINGSIKKFIRDTIKDPDKLDSILDMIYIDKVIDENIINGIIDGMTAEVLQGYIKSEDYKDDVIDFILGDIKKPGSAMLDAVVDHIMNDDDYKNKLVAEIVNKLKNGEAEASIIDFIKNSDDLLKMVIEDLQSDNSIFMDDAAGHIKGKLKTDAGLRKMILTSDNLKEILEEAAIKDILVDKLTEEAFIDSAMENDAFRSEMVHAIVNEEAFMDKLVKMQIFSDYVVDNLHHGDLRDDIEGLLKSPSTDAINFRKKIIDEIKENETFLDLIKEGGALRNDIIKFSDFVEDKDNFVAYVLGQLSDAALGEALTKYSFITPGEIEDILEDEFTGYDRNMNKALYFEYLYAPGNEDDYNTAKLEIINEAQAKFNAYKDDILNKIIAGEEITDINVNDIISDLLVEHTLLYIDEDKDNKLEKAEEDAIENVLIHYVGDVLTGKSSIGVSKEMTDHIDALKENLLTSNDSEDKQRIIELVDEYIAGHKDEVKGIISADATYKDIVGKLVEAVKSTDSDIYKNVDTMLADNADSITTESISSYIKAKANSDLNGYIKTYVTGMDEDELAVHIKDFMTDAVKGVSNTATVEAEIKKYLEKEENIRKHAEDFVNDSDKAAELKEKVDEFVLDVPLTFVEDNIDTIKAELKKIEDLSGLVDKDAVKEHISGLSDVDKQNFADTIYNTLIKTDDVNTFIDSLVNEKEFDITKENLSIIKAIAEALRSFEYEDVMKEINNATINKIVDIVGEDFIKGQFDAMMGNYCDGLDEVIAEVEADNVTRQYTTSLTVVVDIINDLYVPLYEKGQSKVESKIQNVFGINFAENPYIKFLVEDDITARLFIKTVETDDSTGYAIKDVLDYYDYIYMLLLVTDDAACWYGIDENVSDEEIDAIYEAAIGKVLYAHSKVNEILETYLAEDKLPGNLKTKIQGIQQINNAFVKIEPTLKSIIDKYLKSSVNGSLENGNVPGAEKGEKLIDFIIGQEEPVVNIDTIYKLFYYFDDSVRTKLGKLVETDKFKKAVEKFEESSIGSKFTGNGKLGTAYSSVYDLFIEVAKNGLESFRIEKDVITTEDAYKVEVGSVVIIIKRYYE